MHAHSRIYLAEIVSNPHYRTTCSHAGDKCVRNSPNRFQLQRNLPSGSQFICFNVILIFKLTRKKHPTFCSQFLTQTDTSQKAPLLFTDQLYICPHTLDDIHTFFTEPI